MNRIISAVNLTVNPCKMCMPMGMVTAFYGLKKCITILHGSQGCSTYIRRHMSTHYNEPVDIASSSLSEEEAVFGGEKELIRGIENLIEQYHPEVIGVGSTCLSETIGEDIFRIVDDFYHRNPGCNVKIIPVHSAGYLGTQYEGFWHTLISIVKSVNMCSVRHDRINIVTGALSPGDTRALKRILKLFMIDVILLPDLSENLDSGYAIQYKNLPGGGTSIQDIEKMAGAKLTVELGIFPDDDNSVGYYLEKVYSVPCIRVAHPVGLQDTDAFLCLLSQISGNKIPDELNQERNRYLDTMIDTHKYNAKGKAAIFGDPEFVYSISRLCIENGVAPLLMATGTKNEFLKQMLNAEVEDVIKYRLIDRYVVRDNADFAEIKENIEDLGVNIMIGNSDGRRIEEELGVPLIRCAFPVHDRIGGQRLTTMFYAGSESLLENIANTLLKEEETSYREKIYQNLHKNGTKQKTGLPTSYSQMDIKRKTALHPCYNQHSKTRRIHLPVAPACNIKCKYCVRKFDCPNESRPGVTSTVLTPEEALERYRNAKSSYDNLTVAGIAGPGDALADFDKTKKTLELIRDFDPDVTFCLSTNGLRLPRYAEELIHLGVSHITVTLNAIDPVIGAKIYKYVQFDQKKYNGTTGAALLLANQLAGIQFICNHGILCKVNTVVLKGINDHHLGDIMQKIESLGCAIANIVPIIPVSESEFGWMQPISDKEVMELRKTFQSIIPQMYHCKQCRADACGYL